MSRVRADSRNPRAGGKLFFVVLRDFSQTIVFAPGPALHPGSNDSGYVKSSTRDTLKGRARQAKGAVKEKAGKAFGNPDLQNRGTAEKVSGTIQKKVGDVKRVFGK